MKLGIIVIIVVILIVVGLGILVISPKPEVHVSVNGTGPGWITISLDSNTNITSASIYLARPAALESCQANSCIFRYWIAPGDPSGNYTARVHATTELGDVSKDLPVKLNSSGWGQIGDLYYYGGNFSDIAEKYKSKDVSVIAYFTPDESKENSLVIRAEMIIVAGLSTLNKTIHFYAITTDNSSCRYALIGENKTMNLTVKQCMENASKYPEIFIEQPDYPTSQVRVDDSFYLEPSSSGVQTLAKNFMIELAKYIKH